MIPEYDKVVSVRIPSRLKTEIDKMVENGKVKSVSEFIRKAVEKLLMEVEKA